MTNEELESLGKRAVACKKHFRWMPGMLTIQRARCQTSYSDAMGQRWAVFYGSYIRYRAEQVLPDLSDPATLGWLLHWVREAWSDDGLSCVTASYSDGVYLRRVVGGHHHGSTFQAMSQRKYSTEAEALVAALEAAP